MVTATALYLCLLAFVPGRLLADLFSLLARLLLLGGVVLPWVVCPFSGLYGPFLETVLSSSGPDDWICVSSGAVDRCDLCHHS